MAKLAEGIRIVDADSHMTERHDLFTERAPKGFEDKVPHVVEIDGRDMWVVDGHTFGKAGSGGTVDRDGNKHPFRDSQGGSWGIDDVHLSAWDPVEWLKIMDEFRIDTQIIHPNAIGIGGQNLVNIVNLMCLVKFLYSTSSTPCRMTRSFAFSIAERPAWLAWVVLLVPGLVALGRSVFGLASTMF